MTTQSVRFTRNQFNTSTRKDGIRKDGMHPGITAMGSASRPPQRGTHNQSFSPNAPFPEPSSRHLPLLNLNNHPVFCPCH